MKDSMLKRTLLVFVLLITSLWLQEPAAAQSLEQPGSNARPLAGCSGCDAEPASASTRSPKTADAGEDTLLRKEKKQSLVKLTITTADRRDGITGLVENTTTGAKIRFQSRRDGEQLVSRIQDKDGNTLIEYIESQQEVVNPAPDAPPSFEWVPWLRVNGIEYKGYEGEILDDMKALVSNETGELIRQLAIYLVFYASGEDLEAERRGLEVPYQAVQRFYERSYKKSGIGVETKAGPAELSSKLGAKYVDTFTLVPNGCQMPDCKFVETHDYQLTEQGGFVVKSLSPRLTLSNNFSSPAEISHREGGVITPMDDGGQVGDCFGRCGAGCGDWTHEWISRTEYDETYCQEVQFPSDMPIDCSWMCCLEERRLVGSSGIAVHTAHGKVTPGAIAHDWCCRNLFWGCWNPACIALLPGAADCLIPGVGWDETWSYVGPHSDAYTYSTGNCCYQQ